MDAQFDSEPLQQVLAELPRPDDLNVELRITHNCGRPAQGRSQDAQESSAPTAGRLVS